MDLSGHSKGPIISPFPSIRDYLTDVMLDDHLHILKIPKIYSVFFWIIKQFSVMFKTKLCLLIIYNI